MTKWHVPQHSLYTFDWEFTLVTRACAVMFLLFIFPKLTQEKPAHPPLLMLQSLCPDVSAKPWTGWDMWHAKSTLLFLLPLGRPQVLNLHYSWVLWLLFFLLASAETQPPHQKEKKKKKVKPWLMANPSSTSSSMCSSLFAYHILSPHAPCAIPE